MSEDPELVVAGRLGKAFGTKGEIRVISYIEPGDMQNISRFFVEHKTLGLLELKLSDIRPHGKGLVLGFAGVDTRERAKQLSGCDLLVNRNDLPELQEGEFYAFQLVGKRLTGPGGQHLGTVDNITQVPGYFLIHAGDFSVPFTERFVKEVSQDQVILRETGQEH